jgi:hypothetical protein
MRMRTILTALAMLFGLAGAPLCAETPVDGHIVRVVYQFTGGGNWGFHLADMKDGRYCLRFGNPGRLTLKMIDRVADICFETMPGSVERSTEHRSQAFDTRQKGKRITVVSYHKGSIAADGGDITLDIATCNRIEGEEPEARCRTTHYVVHMRGESCSAEIRPERGGNRIASISCQHYPAE